MIKAVTNTGFLVIKTSDFIWDEYLKFKSEVTNTHFTFTGGQVGVVRVVPLFTGSGSTSAGTGTVGTVGARFSGTNISDQVPRSKFYRKLLIVPEIESLEFWE